MLAAAGCGEDGPPLDELPLRDALRADPAVIAAMPADARQRLAARLETARAADDATDPVGGGDLDAAALVAQVDDARARRSGEPLIVGEIVGEIAGDAPSRLARALPSAAASADGAPPLPALEVDASAPVVTPLESRALQGVAAGPLRALLAASGAHHLRRVVGWPSGAVAVGDTVHVGGAWLAALAPADAESNVDGGATAASPATGPGAAAGAAAAPIDAGANGVPDGGATPAFASDDTPHPPPGYADGGVIVYVPPTPTPAPTPPPMSSAGDSCGAATDSGAACAATSDSSDDSCDSTSDDGTDDSCGGGTTTDDGTGDSCSNTTDDGSQDSCNTTADDGEDTNCQIGRPGRQRGGARHKMQATLFGPLAFLLTRRRR